MIAQLLLAFALTVVVEGLIASALLRRIVWLENLGVQCATWPIAQALLWRGVAFWPIELGVAIVEMVLWRMLATRSWLRAALVSLAANAATAFVARFVFNT